MPHSERLRDMRVLIAKEMELNDVFFPKDAWFSSEAVYNEITHVLVSEFHEGRVPPCGVLFVENLEKLDRIRKIKLQLSQLDLARKLANGTHSFLLYEKDQFYGLIFFSEPLINELQVLRLLPICGGLIIQKNSHGVTKFFKQDSITIHESRIWFNKPNVKDAARRISLCISEVNQSVLKRVLESAFHFMSPDARSGATLVWYLEDPSPEELKELSTGEDLTSFQLSILDSRDSAAIYHFLSQIDGATILDSHGKLLRTGVQLRYSPQSSALIPELKGTRHTSAKRFSYDHHKTLVLAISEDGPVTVFSDGVSIADLRVHSSRQMAKLLKNIAPEKTEGVSHRAFECRCKKCGKLGIIDEVKVLGCKQLQKIACPVCKEELYASQCFTLEHRPYKKLSASALAVAPFKLNEQGLG
jgi:DNA integrity scanning protein DisA with diadenylate cyclase activity